MGKPAIKKAGGGKNREQEPRVSGVIDCRYQGLDWGVMVADRGL